MDMQGKASAERCSPGFFRFTLIGSIVLFNLAIGASQDGTIVRSVQIEGNKTLSATEITREMQVVEGRPTTSAGLEQGLLRLITRYLDEGYPFARIDSFHTAIAPDSAKMDLFVALSEGKPAVVRSIEFEGASQVAIGVLQEKMEHRAGRRFIPRLLEADLGNLLQVYEQNGYPFARISVKDLSFEQTEVEALATVVLQIHEGSAARLMELKVEGNTSTRTDVIVREARMKQGALFHGDEPEKIKRRLERTQLFSSVSLPELYLNNDGAAGLLVRVSEGNPNRFDGIVGYVPSSLPGEQGYITGLLDIQFRNIFGTGRKLSTRWYRENQSSQEIQLAYREPWVASYPVNLEGEFFQRKQDSTYIRRRYSLYFDVMLTEELSIGASFSRTGVIPTEGYGARLVSESQTTTVGLSIFYDSRNDPITPTEGVRYRTEYHTGVKETSKSLQPTDDSKSTTQRLTLDFEWFIPTLARQVVATSFYVRDFRSGSVELSDLFRLGGTNTLRGYRESQFLGSRLAWSNLEYRVLVGPRSFAYGFVDAGYIMLPHRPSVGLLKSEQTKVGYGAGIRLDSALGLIGVSLAFGQGDTFSTAKLHFRLVNEF